MALAHSAVVAQDESWTDVPGRRRRSRAVTRRAQRCLPFSLNRSRTHRPCEPIEPPTTRFCRDHAEETGRTVEGSTMDMGHRVDERGPPARCGSPSSFST
jgi:hypothetical protein